MKVKIKKTNNDGVVRLESQGEIKEVIINEEFLEPSEESISLCFRGDNSSGIIEIKTEEFERIFNTVKKRLHLIKGIKKIE
jgi:hypothetical protein